MKKILMFCTSFFNYENRIADALRKQNFEVDLWDERPSHSFVGKSFVRLNIPFYRPVIRRYYENIIANTSNKQYDYVLVVKGEAVNEEVISLLREAYPNATFILYLWDSVNNIPDCENRMKFYDRVVTFDPYDAKRFHIPFLSIPYDENSWSAERVDSFEYDVAFIGTAHSIRPRVVKMIQKQCQNQGLSCYVYLYSPHILLYFLNKLTNPDYRWVGLKDIHFQPLSTDEVNSIYAVSRCVLDIEHPRQQGTTTRPVEMLPMRKKIVTTNPHVYDFPFYDSNNFCLIDRDNPQIDPAFLDLQYRQVGEDILKEYSPSQFAKKLIDLSE